MAKPNKYDIQHFRNLGLTEKQIEKIYDMALKEAAAIGASIHEFNPDKPFSFADYPQTKARIDKLTKELQKKVETVIVNGVRSGWTLANNKNSELSRQVFGENVGKLTKEQYSRYFNNNDRALEAFVERKTNGLNLSDRVWNYTSQFKSEIEMGLDLGIRDGLPAAEMARDLKQYLNEPDRLYRRFRFRDEDDKDGNRVYSKKWKRRIFDEGTQKYKFVDVDINAYNPGRGVYRSSYKNALRLARTENNIAYRTADHLRWQQLDFVVGVEIRLSNNHTLNGKAFTDICDDLQGKYPKDFKFTGWHPACRCFAIPILKTQDELLQDEELIMNGEEPGTHSVNEVRDVPEDFKKWVAKNADRIQAAEERGTLPYFLKDNKDFTSIPDKSLSVGEFNTVGVNSSMNAIRDINNISNDEVIDVLMSFAKDNPDLFNGELKSVAITKSANEYMSIERQYRLGAGDRIFDRGNVLYISDKNIGGFNPLSEFKGALNAIKNGNDLTFKQEYAVESVWHEFLHAKAKGWSNINNRTSQLNKSMEVANQFCARRSYIPFLESLGGKSTHSADIITKGFGYRNELDNFNLMIDTLKIDKSKLYDFLSDKTTNTKYEDIFGELTGYISKESGIGKSKINKLIEKLDISDFQFKKQLLKSAK
ncbi:MAG: hypothetical protein LBB90_05275 [Tannerella sp.]|jgi:hypothetical protein|nr:hypothetical protein [Tannerella sp.]